MNTREVDHYTLMFFLSRVVYEPLFSALQHNMIYFSVIELEKWKKNI